MCYNNYRMLLTKDENKRPSISEIMQATLIQKLYLQYFENEGNLLKIHKIPLKVSNESNKSSHSINGENQINSTQEKTEETHITVLANESLKVMDLLEETTSRNNKKFPPKSNSENMLLKVKTSKLEENNSKPLNKIQVEIIESKNNENDFVSYQLLETQGLTSFHKTLFISYISTCRKAFKNQSAGQYIFPKRNQTRNKNGKSKFSSIKL